MGVEFNHNKMTEPAPFNYYIVDVRISFKEKGNFKKLIVKADGFTRLEQMVDAYIEKQGCERHEIYKISRIKIDEFLT